MRRTFDPFRLLPISIASSPGQQQRDAIDYLREENPVLREQLGNKRLRLNDDQRRRLAAKAKMLGRPGRALRCAESQQPGHIRTQPRGAGTSPGSLPPPSPDSATQTAICLLVATAAYPIIIVMAADASSLKPVHNEYKLALDRPQGLLPTGLPPTVTNTRRGSSKPQHPRPKRGSPHSSTQISFPMNTFPGGCPSLLLPPWYY
jgi:hypothetical protein